MWGGYVEFLLPEKLKKRFPKMGTKAQPGIFLGWHLKSGCIWSGSYYVALKEDFEEENAKKTNHIPYYRVKEVIVI